MSNKPKSPPRMLQEFTWVVPQLTEASSGGKVKVMGEFANYKKPTQNGRFYGENLWEREMVRLAAALKERRMYGELDHPSDGKTSLSRVSHIVTGLRLEDGKVIGEAEIIPTARGKDLLALLQTGCRVGISSRGYGSTQRNEEGHDVVQEDYKLVTFDFVAEPADATAFPDVFFEGLELDMPEQTVISEETREEALAKEQEMAQKFAKAIEDARESERSVVTGSLRKEFQETLVKQIAEMKAELRDEVRGELLSDPSVAGAKKALGEVKDILRPYVMPEDANALVQEKDAEIGRLKNQLAERDLNVQSLQDEMAKMAGVLKEAGYKLYLERQLQGDPNADLLRKLIGDVKSYDSAGEIQSKLDAAREEMDRRSQAEEALAKKQAEQDALQEAREMRLQAEAEAAKQAAQAKVDKLVSVLEESAALNRELGLRLYAKDQLINHPRASRINTLLESNLPDTKEGIDEVISQFREPRRSPEQLESVRSRVRGRLHGGYSSTPDEEETPRPHASQISEDFNGLGISLTDLLERAGVHQD